MVDFSYLSALELLNLYRQRELSPLEVTKAALARIDQVNPRLNAFVTVTPEVAQQQRLPPGSAKWRRGVTALVQSAIPCGFSGVYGLKPSWGRVPQYPPSAVEQLSHIGPITRTVRDAALMLDVIAQPDVLDRTSLPKERDYLAGIDAGIKGLRVAWSSDLGYAAVEPEVKEIASAAAGRFAELGCEIDEIHPRAADPWEWVDVIWSTGFAGLFHDNFAEVREQLDPGFVAVIERGQRRSAAELASAYNRRTEYYHAWRLFMEQYDLMLTPTLPLTAFAAGADYPETIGGRAMSYLSWTAFTYPFNLTGQPAASVPCGFAA